MVSFSLQIYFLTEKLRNRTLTFTECTNYHLWLFLEPVYQPFQIKTFVGSLPISDQSYSSLKWEKQRPSPCTLKVESALCFPASNFFKVGGGARREGEDRENFVTRRSANFSQPNDFREPRACTIYGREIHSYIWSMGGKACAWSSRRKSLLRLGAAAPPWWHCQQPCHAHSVPLVT